MQRIEDREMEAHRETMAADAMKLVEKYRKIFDWDVHDIDQAVADQIILNELRKALDKIQSCILVQDRTRFAQS